MAGYLSDIETKCCTEKVRHLILLPRSYNPTMATCPYLLYAYPWMPFPRRVIIYIREKSILPSLVTVVPVSDPQLGDAAPAGFPPRPKGSLPILVIPHPENESNAQPTYIRQSVAIMNYLDELCDAGANGFPKSQCSMRGPDVLSRARETGS
jgi:hypothetical protein